MSIFQKKFATLLEADVLAPDPITDTEPRAAEVPGGPEQEMPLPALGGDVEENPAINYTKEQNAKMSGDIQAWIGKISEFNGFLNGLDSNSMQSQLNNAPCDTLFDNVSRSETKKISRVAQDLSGLIESLKGYLLSADSN